MSLLPHLNYVDFDTIFKDLLFVEISRKIYYYKNSKCYFEYNPMTRTIICNYWCFGIFVEALPDNTEHKKFIENIFKKYLNIKINKIKLFNTDRQDSINKMLNGIVS